MKRLTTLLALFFLFAAPVYAATVLFPSGGGTGTNTGPSYGQLLVGTSGGIYTPTATSSIRFFTLTTTGSSGAATYSAGTLNIPQYSGGASTTLLGDNNTFSGNDIFNNTITGSVSGNAGTATKLITARAINGVNFDGSAAITIFAASSTLLANNNTFSGVNLFTNAASDFSGTWQTFSPSHFATPSDVAASYPFQLSGNATSTLTQFNGGLTAYASSTIGGGSVTTGLTINGNATTTGNAYIAGKMGIVAAASASSLLTLGATTLSGAADAVLQLGATAAGVTVTGSASNGQALIHARNTFNVSATGNVAGIDVVPTFNTSANITFVRGSLFGGFFNPAVNTTVTNASGIEWVLAFGATGAGLITNGNTVLVDSPLKQGTVVPTNLYGIHVLNQGLAGATTTYGLYVDAQSGATNNYSAIFNGTVGISTSTPGSLFSIGNTNGINFSTATSSFSSTGGINLAAGCYAIAGVCVAGTGGSGTVTSVGLSDSNSTLTIGGTPVTTSGTLTATLNLSHSNIWSALQQFSSGLTAYASSTIGDGTRTGGLTVNGTATTTTLCLTGDTCRTTWPSSSSGPSITYVTGNYYGPDTSAVTTASIVANRVYFVPIWIYSNSGFDRVGIQVTTAVAASSVFIGMYDTGTDGRPNNLLASTTVSSAATGFVEGTISWTPTPGLYWGAVLTTASGVVIRGPNGQFPWIATATGSDTTNLNRLSYTQSGQSTLPNAATTAGVASLGGMYALRSQ